MTLHHVLFWQLSISRMHAAGETCLCSDPLQWKCHVPWLQWYILFDNDRHHHPIVIVLVIERRIRRRCMFDPVWIVTKFNDNTISIKDTLHGSPIMMIPSCTWKLTNEPDCTTACIMKDPHTYTWWWLLLLYHAAAAATCWPSLCNFDSTMSCNFQSIEL